METSTARPSRKPQYIYPASRQEWLRAREGGIGSSEVATILGLNPYETPYALWQRRVGMAPPRPETLPMRLGHLLEPAVAALWADATGLAIRPESVPDFLIRWPDAPYIQVSPDRIFDYPAPDGSIRQGILECKTTQRAVGPDSIPDAWICQVQYQLGVAGLTRGAIACLSRGHDFSYYEVEFAPELFSATLDAAETFYRDNLLARRAPAPLRAEDVEALFPRGARGTAAEANPEVYRAYQDLCANRRAAKALEAREAPLLDMIKIAIGAAEALTFQGRELATWKAPKPARRFNAKAFAKDHPDLYDAYLEEAPAARRFLLKEPLPNTPDEKL